MGNDLKLFIFDSDHRQVRGPYAIISLKELVEVGKVTPETMVSIGKDHEWREIKKEESLMGLLFPDTPGLHLVEDISIEKTPESKIPVDVYDMLKENRAVEDDDKLIVTDEDLENARIFNLSRRTKDYLSLLVISTVIALFAGFFMGALFNPLGLMFLLSGWVMANVGFAFVIYIAMDTY